MDVAGVPRTFESLHRDLLPGGPHVQPKPWESIASESGAAVEGPASVAGKIIYGGDDASSISENELVRLVLNALQGVKSAVDSIEKLSSLFLLIPADRSYRSIPSVWCRSLSTNALGKILQSVGQSGSVVCFLRNFVDYFLNSGSAKVRGAAEATTVLPRGGLVNQAFAVAVRKILEEYMCALNTLYESVKLRRFAGSADGSVDDSFRHGCLTSIAHSDITVLEVHLHTKELLTHIESLGNICLFGSQVLNASVEALAHRISNESYTIPAGSDLLTYLYTLLRYADPVHRSLLEFLFVQSCEPYCGFIKSWIYGASVDDPYQEFVARDMEDSVSWMHLKNTNNNSFQFGSEKDQAVAVPCFLEDVRIPLLRTGLQLQVLIRMLNICKWNIANTRGYTKSSPLELEEVLPFWREYFTGDISHTSTLFFDKKAMNTLALSRKKAFSLLWKNLETFLSRMDLASDQNSPNRSLVSKSNQRLPEIQGLLDSALQKSSCESDRFKDRLFVFLEEVDDGLGSSSTLRISAFNRVTLGYIVNWPVNIILSPTALNVYSKIFKFLSQIKLSVCSLNHVWCLLKDTKYLDSRLSMDDIKCFKFITRMRQQLNHFVCTLQQYVQSQLSHVSWCNFIVSLRNQVKDILDLDSLHMSYLAGALLICFLSNEARHTADVILRILQCALDFEACCSGVIGVPKLDGDCSILPATLINEVSVIKSSFEEHLKELYICYQKTPKHRQFGLHQFWEYLNYNDYFSNSIMLAASRNVESISNYIS